MGDLSIDLGSRIGSEELRTAFLRVVDREGRIPAALEALGPIADRDVVVLEADAGFRVRQLVERGARVTALVPPGRASAAAPDPIASLRDAAIVEGVSDATGLPDRSADAVISFWTAFDGPDEHEIAEAERILRPGGRLLVVHDYGRDDICDLWRTSFLRQVEWSRRNGPFLSAGFRIRVIHCWWTFESADEARAMLGEAFGEAGLELAAKLKRPRLEYNIAVYHRTSGSVPDERVLVGSAMA